MLDPNSRFNVNRGDYNDDWNGAGVERQASNSGLDHEDAAVALVDAIAPEHLHVQTAEAERVAERITNAGAIFVGSHSPVALGDYAAGPSHVLPTSGTARFASGLSSNDFLRAGSILHFTHEGLMQLASDVKIMATKEGLTGHRASVEVRMKADL